MILNPCGSISLEELLGGHIGGTVAWKTELFGAIGWRKSLPFTHGVDDVNVTMDASVDTFLPAAILHTIIAA